MRTVFTLWQCDGCGTEQTTPGPEPEGWYLLLGVDLCKECYRSFKNWKEERRKDSQ